MEGFHSPAVNPRALLVQLPSLVCASAVAAAQLGLWWAGVGSRAGREIWGWARLGRRPRACRDNLFLQLAPGELRDWLG